MQVRRGNDMNIPGGKRDIISVSRCLPWAPLPDRVGIYFPVGPAVSDHYTNGNRTVIQQLPASERPDGAFVTGRHPLTPISCLNGHAISRRSGST